MFVQRTIISRFTDPLTTFFTTLYNLFFDEAVLDQVHAAGQLEIDTISLVLLTNSERGYHQIKLMICSCEQKKITTSRKPLLYQFIILKIKCCFPIEPPSRYSLFYS